MSLPAFLGAALLLAAAASAQTPKPDGGILVWPKGVPPQGIKHKDDFGSHILSVSHREQDGRVEVHKTKADVMVIQSGEADLVTGGEILEPVTTAPDELQGSSIRGGVKIHVVPGDVIHIPVGVAHQFFLAPGAQITYLVVKVIDPKPDLQHATH
jgi:mannose-6-phosphate isomerase-like protein (cupin superfamily)